ncbi:ATP-binding cassette domain-containing protein [Arthrobacter sp. R1-13]
MKRTIALDPISIKASGIGKQFGDRNLWNGMSFTIRGGEMVAISGVSGSGKTTLLNCIGLLEKISTGSLTIGDQDVSKIRGAGRRNFFRKKLGYLFQNFGLVDSWTVDQNLDVALAYSKLRSAEKVREKLTALERVGLADLQHEKVFKISGGEQQRTALARLLLKRPSVILADEPTGSLDRTNADTVMRILKEFQANGAMVLISTHDPRVVEQCDRTIALN